VITTVERNRATARWKEMMEKDFDIVARVGGRGER
jgi:hypothetical protein